jgi:excisionase family DNA binding protein
MSALASLPSVPSPDPVLPERTYTADDLAKLLQVDRWTIYNWADRGNIPPGHKIGRVRRWLASDIAPLLGQRDG